MYKQIIFIISIVSFTSLKAQVAIDNSLSAQELIEDVLVSEGVTISNVTVSGNLNLQAAAFTDPNSNYGFTEGLYMSTGRTSRINQNSFVEANDVINLFNQDRDLAQLLGVSQNDITDAMIIEFDFIPNGDSISFKYVFASDEYPEYVCSQYNDGFGFFLRGPGINGPYSNNSANLALIPNTSVEVAINSVNRGSPGAFADGTPCNLGNSAYYQTNNGPTIYDARTVILEAKAAVQCGETYHIKLAIADILDGSVDSGVFLEANSFNSTNIGLALDGPAYDLNNDEVYEGCEIDLIFTRPPSDTTGVVTIPLEWTGTATENVDYTGSVQNIVFPPQVDTFIFPINVLLDNLSEGIEVIEVSLLTTACSGSGFTFEVKLNDPPPLVIGMADTIEVSCTDSIRIDPLISGGTNNYIFDWKDGTGNTISTNNLSNYLSASDEGVFSVNVTDSCSQESLTKVFFLRQERINAIASFQVTNPVNCLGDSVMFENTSPSGNVFTWSNNGTVFSTEFEPMLVFSDLNDLNIQLLVEDSTGCLFADSISSIISVNDSAYAEFETEVVCPNTTFTLESLDQSAGNSYNWFTSTGATGTQPTIDLSFTSAGDYQVTLVVTNSAGCTDEITKNITAGATTIVDADFSLTSDRYCLGTDIFPVNNTANATDYLWTSGNGDTSILANPQFSYPDTGFYTITLFASSTEECTNTDIETAVIHVESVEANFVTDTLCQFETFEFTSLINNSTISMYDWQLNGVTVGTSNPYTHTFNEEGDYVMELTVTSDIGCSDSKTDSFRVEEKPITQFEQTSLCVGSFTEFTNTSIGDITDFLWDFGDGQTSTANEPIHIFWDSGFFDVQLIAFSVYCPNDTFTKSLESTLVPEINIGDDLALCNNETEMIGIPDSVFSLLDFVLWSDSSTSDSILVSNLMTSVSVTGTIGTCSKSDAISISEKCDVYVPTAFTPNGDGFNDYLNVLDENISTFTMKIYNRWGEELFSTSDFNIGWDGNHNGKAAPIDTYSYVITGIKIDGSEFTASGIFAIMR